LGAPIGRRMLRGARIGLAAGLSLAGLYFALGVCGSARPEFLGYSLLAIGFPSVFAILPLLQWIGLQGGLRECVPLVLLALPLNGSLWGAVLGAMLTSPARRDPGS
jgi:hypothetical protein